MNPEDNGTKKYDDPAEVMLLLAKEADDVIAQAGKSARQEAEDETAKMLLQYGQRAKQIVLKIREEARASADEMAARFRDALILRVEEASTTALDETIKGVGIRADEIIQNMQQAVKKETRQALAEGLVAGDDQPRPAHAPLEEEKPVVKTGKPEESSLISQKGDPAPKAPEDFGKWLMQ